MVRSARRNAMATERVDKLRHELEYGRLGVGRDLEHLAPDAVRRAAADDRIHHVADKNEIPRLPAVAINFPGAAGGRLANEFGYDAALVARQRSVAIAEPQGDGLDAEAAPVGRTVGFAGKLARAIGRYRVGRQPLVDRRLGVRDRSRA